MYYMKNYKLSIQSLNNYSVGTAGTTNNTYAIDWTFLPPDKSFLVSFNFITNRYNFSGANANNSQVLVSANLGQYNNYTGNATIDKMQNIIIGGLKLYRASTRSSVGSQTDIAYKANIKTNPPIYIDRRPTDNFLNIVLTSITDSDVVLNNFTLPYLMNLYFQEI